MIVTVHNLCADETMTFCDVSPLMAVMSAHCYSTNKGSWFSQQIGQSEADIAKHLPVTFGTRTIACGDWSAKTQ